MGAIYENICYVTAKRYNINPSEFLWNFEDNILWMILIENDDTGVSSKDQMYNE